MPSIYTKLKTLAEKEGADGFPEKEYYDFQDATIKGLMPHVEQFRHGLISVTEFYDQLTLILTKE